MPKTHVAYWEKKFERNVERDAEKQALLREMGWTVLVVWECQVKHNLPSVVRAIELEWKASARE